jgi:hypothetical protein
VIINPYGKESIDFANPDAVRVFNRALLKAFYGIAHWDIPADYLCPPVPGRADYVHFLADLLASVNDGVIPRGPIVRVLDIGMGANCVYPLIGHAITAGSSSAPKLTHRRGGRQGHRAVQRPEQSHQPAPANQPAEDPAGCAGAAASVLT